MERVVIVYTEQYRHITFSLLFHTKLDKAIPYCLHYVFKSEVNFVMKIFFLICGAALFAFIKLIERD